MISRLSNSLLLGPGDIPPSNAGWKVIGVFNPAIARVHGLKFMVVRVAEQPLETRTGWTALPVWSNENGVSVEWIPNDRVQRIDARVIRLKPSGELRLTSVSHFQVLRQSTSDILGWEPMGKILPQGRDETFGIEDARITEINNVYWITYVAVSRAGITTSLMSSTDLVTFERHGIIFATENKDVVLFPERIGGDYVALHRPIGRSYFSSPQIWIARSPDLIHWGELKPMFQGTRPWESERVGSGTPPILLDEGWLTLYHGSASTIQPGQVGRYCAGALLLDRADPIRVIARSHEPIMSAVTEYERNGFVPNVVFPTAILDCGDDLEVFYGAADTAVAMVSFSKRSVLDSLSPQRES